MEMICAKCGDDLTPKPMTTTNWREQFRKIGEGSVRFIATREEVENLIESLLAKQKKELSNRKMYQCGYNDAKKELTEEIKEELRTWINDNNVDFNGTDVTYTAELANYVDNKLKHND